jgi:predicted amidohydrolase
MRVFDAPSARLAVVVGEDLLFPDFCRIAALSGAEVVLCPSLVAGGVVRNLRTACRARAFEGSVFVANANGIPADRSGQRLIVGGSTVAGPYCGRNVLAALGPGEGVATARLDIGRLRADRRAPQGSGPAGRVRRLGLDPNRSVELLGRLGLELDVEIRTVKGSGED